MMRAVVLAVLAVAAAGGAMALDLPPMPLYKSMPPGCGALAQVTEEVNTCDKIAEAAGISVATMQFLNPFLVCLWPLQIGSSVCTGNTISFCSNVVVASAGDTCKSIEEAVAATVVNVAGTNATTCKTLTAGVPVCVSDAVQTAATSTLGSTPLSPSFQTMLGSLPDIVAIIAEDIATVESSTVEGIPALVVTITQVTPAVTAALPNSGHPYLKIFAEDLAAGNAESLVITLVPHWFNTETPGLISAVVTPKGNVIGRKMLGGQYQPRTVTQTSCCKNGVPNY
eukprot:CAMPEP_0206135048 /NCGR_PEP_ID=MMETSP1473-20131121/415_1 /ASSEMBLY_ACC=CAM_ASM_001109 /TAXON_ID=1461547 /ORGANISM="Stichococcus sp, Strain RCC1054" /LENGTH=282 /DNA_ID=CAMNT_0053526753 /DNA_START=270 /DNA_END=1118 /DNA_ORIENTATION=-